MMKPKLRVRFRNKREIRMGSPYSICDISFSGEWIPPLPETDWQDRKAVSPDGETMALVLWNTAGNCPGFHVIRIDLKNRTYHKTKRIMGICKSLRWDGERFVWERVGD